MDILSREPPKADHRISYGKDSLQFGDLWIPVSLPARTHAGGLAPVIVMIHGGWWQNTYDLAYCGFLCNALKTMGIAVWSIEYRRVGDPGGGWPGTMQDTAAGFDFLTTLAKSYPIDLHRVAAAGHSAGGQLAFWLAGRHHIPSQSPLHEPQPKIAVRGVVALAGAVDLRLTIDLSGYFEFPNGKPAVLSLMGGTPQQFPERYRAANPGDLLPLSVRQVLVQGTDDEQIPPTLPARYAQNARRQGDVVDVKMVPGAGHFDVVDPESAAWPMVRAALLQTVS
jgi:acetyl esterase/lipase